MLFNKKILFKKKEDTEKSDLEVFLDNLPMLVILGSMDASSRSDVIAYARGIAESQVIAKEACFLDANKQDGRFIFEIHEGGAGFSIATWVAKIISDTPDARINVPLTGGRVANVSQSGGDVVTIIHPPDEDRHAKAVAEISSFFYGRPLAPFYESAESVKNAAAFVFCVSAVVFTISGASLFINSNAISVEKFTDRFAVTNIATRTDVKNLPAKQLDLAMENLKSNSGYLSYLKLENKRWTWAQSTSGVQQKVDPRKSDE